MKIICIALMLLSSVVQAQAAVQSDKEKWEEAIKEARKQAEGQSFQQYLEKSIVLKDEVDRFVRGEGWAKFDPELGYILNNSLMPWGIDGSSAIETIQPNGARTTIMYADRKVRINTYGDSFTESEQVNDGETWQEYLAAHLGEPVRNFGVGGFGVYQAYRRMIREEKTDHGAEYVILMIWGDDATRSLYRSRWTAIYPGFRQEAERSHLFHANFWANMEMDLKSGHFVEKEQLLPTKESLYRMTEPKWMAEHLKDDMALQLFAYSQGYIDELDRKRISALARNLGFTFDWNATGTAPNPYSSYPGQPSTISRMQVQTFGLLNRYSQRATLYILDKAKSFVKDNGKKLLVILNGTVSMEPAMQGRIRDDQEILDYLVKEEFNYLDLNAALMNNYRQAKTTLSFAEYFEKYMVDGFGHFNPLGNNFTAYSIKNKMVDLLDPKPIPYQQPATQTINFKGYLHGGAFQ